MVKGFSRGLSREFKGALKNLKESKNYIYLALGIFVLFVFVGAFLKVPENLSNQIVEYFKKLLQQTEGYSSLRMIVFIFKNNVLASFISLFGGIFFGIFSLIALVFNGFVLGFASKLAVSEQGLLSLWRLFPHGVFELPALIISLGFGLKLGSSFFRKNPLNYLKKVLKNSLRVFVFIVVPLLIIAAIIEGSLIVFLG